MASSRSTAVVALLLALVTALVAWWAIGAGEAASPAVLRPEPEAPSPPLAEPERRATAEESAAAAERTVVEVVPEATAEVEPLAFDPDAVYGRVVDESLEPIEGARVFVFDGETRTEFAGEALARFTTDESGRFRVDAPELVRTLRVSIDAPGYVRLLETHQAGIAREFRLRPAARVQGLIVDEAGEPVPDVDVRWTWIHVVDARFVQERVATTDAEGRFELDGALPGTRMTLFLQPPGAIPDERRFTLDDDDVTECRFVLGTTTAIDAVAVDAHTGAALAGVEIRYGEIPVATTDELGRAVLRVRPHRRELELDREEYCRTVLRLSSDLPRPGEPVRLPLVRGGTVVGVVRSADGTPLPGVRVFANSRNPAELPDSDPSFWNLPLDQRDGIEIAPRFITRNGRFTDAEGSFRLDGLAPGERAIRVHARPRMTTTSTQVQLTRPGEEVFVELVIEEPATLAGRVLAGGEATAARVHARIGDSSYRTRSNDAGEFVIGDIVAGDGVVVASLTERGGVRWDDGIPVSLRSGRTTEVELRLPSALATIRGRVTDELGEVVTGRIVTANHGAGRATRTMTASDGTYELSVPAGEPATVSVSNGAGRERAEGVVAPATDVDFVLPLPGKLLFRVVDRTTGRSIHGPVLWGRPQASDRFRRVSRAYADRGEGTLELVLDVGTYDIGIDATERGYVPVARFGVFAEPDPGEPRVVELDRGTRLVLESTSPDLGRVLLRPETGEPGLDWYERDVRFQDGTAEVFGVAPGRYRIVHARSHAGRGSGAVDLETFDVPAVDEHRVTLRWRTRPGR